MCIFVSSYYTVLWGDLGGGVALTRYGENSESQFCLLGTIFYWIYFFYYFSSWSVILIVNQKHPQHKSVMKTIIYFLSKNINNCILNSSHAWGRQKFRRQSRAAFYSMKDRRAFCPRRDKIKVLHTF